MATRIDRKIALAESQEARRRPTTLDGGPDADEIPAEPTVDARVLVPASEDYDGFWKHSEYLKCRAGKPMRTITNYGRGPTWLRAEATNK